MQYEIWKGRKKGSAKGGFELGSIVSKSMRLTIYTPETDARRAYCLVLTNPITRWWTELV